ncbi:MAG TPA: TolC family protein [Pirellulales bacterium]|nr:TolC family protein [Pirellulales bacterium]
MSVRDAKFWAMIAAFVVLITGCQPSRPFYFFEDGDLSHYKGVATEVEYPDVNTDTIPDVSGSLPPLTLQNPEPKEFWPLRLEEAVRITLQNSKVFRTLGGQVQNPTFQVSLSPLNAQTIYAPAITESDPRFGVEGTLSNFDTQWSTSVFWQKNDHPVNANFAGLLANILEEDAAQFQSQLAKVTAAGDRVYFRNNTNYDMNNNPTNLFPAFWTTNFEAEFRHPFLQGGGTQFNRIAGPSGIPGVGGFTNIPGVYNGVAIARTNVDIAIADFEGRIRDVVNDTELAYWELYFSYRNLDALVVGRDSALSTWRKVKALYDAGARGGEAEKEAQAREQYFLFRGQVEAAVSNVYETENRLRYQMGIAPTDGRLIRPADDPTTAKVDFDWDEVKIESLARMPELRRQKWIVKQKELQLIASKNFLLPRLDFDGTYRWLGFGQNLWDIHRSPDQFNNAMQSLTGGQYQEWQMGFQANIPIGFRAALAGVRNAQLQLARERAILQEEELEMIHGLTSAVRTLVRSYELTETNFNRLIAAQVNVKAVRAAYETDTVTLDLLLDAQRRLAVATSDYFRSLVDYNLAIRTVHYRKGSLLEYNNVFLAEGPWPGKAYFDARKRARERDAGLQINYGFIQPNVFSRGPISQKMGTADMTTGNGVDQPPPRPIPETLPESVPTPPASQAVPGVLDTTKAPPPRPGRPGLSGPGIQISSSTSADSKLVSYDWGASGRSPIQAPSAAIATGDTRREGVAVMQAAYNTQPVDPALLTDDTRSNNQAPQAYRTPSGR